MFLSLILVMGAANQGQVYESFNMAKLWNLPVLYVIENNEYGMGTSVSRSCSTDELYRRGESFGIPGKRVDGMNFIEVYNATIQALKDIRSGKGPILLEMKTYRYRGHSMSDPGQYRSKDEVNDYKNNKDPIVQMKKYILDEKILNENDIASIESEVKGIVAESVDFAKNSPEPDEKELYTDVYV